MNQKAREELIRLAITLDGSWTAISAALRQGVQPPEVPLQKALTLYDEAYPESLRALRYPPWVLFYEGNPELLQQPLLSIVGSRDMNAYGRQVTIRCAAALAQRYVLVSGLARGVDGQVHRTAIASGGHTIGIIGSGLGTCYPRQNADLYAWMRKQELILSEYPFHTGVAREHFPWRNRLLAALGEKLIVTQARIRSGTMRTVSEALNLSKEVWCIPWPYDDATGEGCNALIFQGAQILYSPEQLADFVPQRHRTCQTESQ